MGEHFDSEIWEEADFLAWSSRRYNFHAQEGILQQNLRISYNISEDIQPFEVWSAEMQCWLMQSFDLELFRVWPAQMSAHFAPLVSLNREHKPRKAKPECSSSWLILRFELWIYFSSFLINQFNLGASSSSFVHLI